MRPSTSIASLGALYLCEYSSCVLRLIHIPGYCMQGFASQSMSRLATKLLGYVQDYDTVLWLVVLMLQLWDGVERPLGDRQPAEEIHDSFQSLSQMTALYKAVRLAAVSTAQSHQKQSTSNDKQQRPARLAAILFATQEAQCRLPHAQFKTNLFDFRSLYAVQDKLSGIQILIL